MKTIDLKESDIKKIVLRVLRESEESGSKSKKEEPKPRCMPQNIIPLDKIVGKAQEFGTYTPGISKRMSGVNSLVDSLGNRAMDKIIELYKENEHGTELVKDIERVLNLQTKDDIYTPSPRAKEYLKQSINLIKGL